MMLWENGQMVEHHPREGYGFGIMRLSVGLAEYVAPLIRIELTDTMGALKDRGVFDQLKAGLHLPDDYIIRGVYLEALRRTWLLMVEAPGVPIPDEGELIPTLTPVYEQRYNFATERVRDGKPPYEVHLVRVDISPDPYRTLRVD